MESVLVIVVLVLVCLSLLFQIEMYRVLCAIWQHQNPHESVPPPAHLRFSTSFLQKHPDPPKT